MKNLFILKLGGSAITYKNKKNSEPNLKVIINAAKEIKQAMEENNFKLIVVHGAGPYGHKFVSDFGIADGLKNEKDVEGFVRTHHSMEDLNKIISDAFKDAGLLGFPIQPSACIIQKNKKIISFDLKIIKALLEINKDIIPILYGDMVIDRELQASVVSGDAIISYLAKELKVDKVFFGADVEGIFDADPKKQKNAELIPEINKDNVETILRNVSGSNEIDVTGGMKGKLLEIREILKDVEIIVFNITKDKCIYNALSGKPITGTKIKLD